MGDTKPPRAAGDERAVLLALLRYQRVSLLAKVDGLSEEDARSSPVPSGTSLLWLAKHVLYAETIWLQVRFLGEGTPPPNELAPGDTVASVTAAYRDAWPALDAVIEGHDLDETIADPAGPGAEIDLRWIVAHLLEEVARHAGHADILRELLDGRTGR